MSDYMNVKSENFQKFLDHHLKKQKDELIVEFIQKLNDIYSAYAYTPPESTQVEELIKDIKKEYEGLD